MNEATAPEHALHLLALYTELVQANEGYAHDPEERLCSAVVERSSGATETFISYSNPSGLRTRAMQGVPASLIPAGHTGA